MFYSPTCLLNWWFTLFILQNNTYWEIKRWFLTITLTITVESSPGPARPLRLFPFNKKIFIRPIPETFWLFPKFLLRMPLLNFFSKNLVLLLSLHFWEFNIIKKSKLRGLFQCISVCYLCIEKSLDTTFFRGGGRLNPQP